MSADANLHQRALRLIQTDPEQASWPETVREHASRCDRCQLTVTASLRLRAGLRRQSGRAAPADLLLRVQERLAAENPPVRNASVTRRKILPRSSWTNRVWVPAALAAGLALGIGLGPLLRAPGPGNTARIVDGEVVKTVGDYLVDVTHDRYLLERTGRPIEKPVSDRAELSDWLSESTGFAVALGINPSGWELAGGRVWHTVSRISALAEYADGVHRVTVFAVPAAGIHPQGFEDHRIEEGLWAHEAWSFQGIAWYEDDLVWSAVSDLPPDTLRAWVAEYRGRTSQ